MNELNGSKHDVCEVTVIRIQAIACNIFILELRIVNTYITHLCIIYYYIYIYMRYPIYSYSDNFVNIRF